MRMLLDDPVTRAGGVLGFGLGGMADGIVLHQVLQWHHLVSGDTPVTTVAGLEANTVADGVFHLVALAVLVLGAVLLARAAASATRRWGRRALGAALVGWGAFHLVDEVLFHVVLDLHHIRMVEDYLVYDLAFTAIGVIFIAAGARLLAGERDLDLR